ncbi:MAG: hypothetical protein H0X43_02235 [Nitrosospira sp.]|nr:hypothetical protein [Nitrosospira sp.]
MTHNAHSEKSSGGGPQRARPEPMVFDLIDPLGAPKGEFEINALLDYSARTGQIEWSPEIEYSFADGYAVELELPLENTSVDEYKLSFQGTFGELAEGRMIHGWQAIGRGKRQEKAFGAEALYLNGYQFSDRWSMMNMLGIRQTAIARSGDLIGLMNNSLFYSYSERIVLGVELNNEIGERCWRYRLTPQAQYTFGKNKTLKLGGGPSQLNEEQKTDWMLTSRLVYNF